MNHWVTIGFGAYMGTAVLSYVVLMFLSLRAYWLYREGDWLRQLRVSWLQNSGKKSVPGVTILAPAKNEEPIIAESLKALFRIDYPNLSWVIVDDGSVDGTFEILERQWSLVRTQVGNISNLPHQPITEIWQSVIDPRLRVVRKSSNGSKGDANNAGLEIVNTPYVFVTDIDSIVEPDAIAKLVARIEETNAVAVGCPLRPLNGCTVNRDGGVNVRLPKNYWALSQVIEYIRTFQLRFGWASLGMLNNISGAAGLFMTSSLRYIGGYRTDTTAEDLNSTFSFHMKGMKIAFEPSTNVYTQVPETYRSLRSQRRRWARGIFDILVEKWRMLSPKQGRFAFLSAWLYTFEVVEPFVETAGLCFIAAKLWHHTMPMWGWMLLAIGLSITVLLSVASILQTEGTYPRLSTGGKWAAVLLSWIEILPFKIPFALFWRMHGTFAYLRGNKTWEALPRQQFKEEIEEITI